MTTKLTALIGAPENLRGDGTARSSIWLSQGFLMVPVVE
jgi:hypothetical protein